jgi:hypothetical protein
MRAELLHGIYDRIVASGGRIVSARLTPDAHARGMALEPASGLQWRA